MTEAKFTKGPWVKDKWGQIVNPEGKSICVWDCGISIASRDEDAEANPHLIAAAPDMYEALDALVKSVSTGLPTTYGTINTARRALAKARGEQ